MAEHLPPDLWAWVSPDETGHIGVVALDVGNQQWPLIVNSLTLALGFRDLVRRDRVDTLGVQAQLIHYTANGPVATIDPLSPDEDEQ
jgi:hypothetical protein